MITSMFLPDSWNYSGNNLNPSTSNYTSWKLNTGATPVDFTVSVNSIYLCTCAHNQKSCSKTVNAVFLLTF